MGIPAIGAPQRLSPPIPKTTSPSCVAVPAALVSSRKVRSALPWASRTSALLVSTVTGLPPAGHGPPRPNISIPWRDTHDRASASAGCGRLSRQLVREPSTSCARVQNSVCSVRNSATPDCHLARLPLPPPSLERRGIHVQAPLDYCAVGRSNGSFPAAPRSARANRRPVVPVRVRRGASTDSGITPRMAARSTLLVSRFDARSSRGRSAANAMTRGSNKGERTSTPSSRARPLTQAYTRGKYGSVR